MLNVREAIERSVEFSQVVGSEFMPLADPQVEEIEADEVANEWIVTISFARPDSPKLDEVLKSLGTIGALSRAERIKNAPRIYRKFRVKKESGEVVAMKSVKFE